MMRPLILCALSISTLTLTGCLGSNASLSSPQFTLVPDTTGISKDLPAGSLALDTHSGRLCFTLTGSFQSAAPTIPLCETLSKQDDSGKSTK